MLSLLAGIDLWRRASVLELDSTGLDGLVSLTHAHLGNSGYHVLFSKQMMFGGPTIAKPKSHWMVMFSNSAYCSLSTDSIPFGMSGFIHITGMETILSMLDLVLEKDIIKHCNRKGQMG